MFQAKMIMVPVDFSERSLLAAEHAVTMAGQFDSHLLFVHVIPPSPYEYAAFEGGYYTGAAWPRQEELEERAREQMNELVKKVAKDRPIETLVLKGDPATKIKELSEEKKVDLVMMPTHGYGPFRRFVLGSVTSKVLHDVDCPVFTGTHIPELASFNDRPYKRVACALDLRENSEKLLGWAWGFAQACEEDLIIIHAAPSLEFGATYGEWFPMDARDAVVKWAREQVAKLIEKVGCKAEVHVESADAARYIRDTADAAYADVLIIGRSAKTGLLGRLGTHAYAIIREAPCPVISI
jgi:nucleotide-binding universal stress UspA family protein